MRVYAFLLVAGAALCARAASIPVAETEKKITDIVLDNLDKLPENTSSEQELIDQENIINDVDNKLRAKPEDIPVEVIVDKAQPTLKTDEEQNEDINRPVPDLRNPGPPQRQEHETQNPEFYASEQQTVVNFKQSISDAQNVLSQGFQRIAEGIQHIAATNEPIQTLQVNIQSLRDSFTAQIVKVNGTIQSYLNTESASNDKPAAEQTKAGFQQIEQGLFKLRNEFNRGVSTLASGVDVVAALKADNEANNESSGSTAGSATAAPSPAPLNPFMQIMNNMQNQFQTSLHNLQEAIGNWNSPSSTATSPAAAGEVQSDSQVTSAPTTSTTNFLQNIQGQFSNLFGQGLNQGQAQNQVQGQNQGQVGPPAFLGIWPPPALQQQQQQNPVSTALNNIWNFISPNNNKPLTQAPQGTQASSGQPEQSSSKPEEAAVKPDSKPDSAKPAETAASAQADAVTPAGPIRQILQNNPITKGIAGAVQRLQNINNPEKPRDEQTADQVKNLDEDKADAEFKKGGGPNTGDNYDSSNSSDRVEQPEEVKEEIEKVPEIQKIPEVQKVPEVQKASEDEIKEHKTEEVVDKTE